MSRTAGRPRDPELDARILDAARAILAEEGLDALTVASVSARAQVGRPSIYRRYAGTGDLAKAVLFADLDEVVAEVRGTWDLACDPVEQLVGIATRIFTYYARNPRVSAGMLQMALGGTGPWSEALNEQLEGFLAWITGRLEATRDRGGLLPHADCALIAHAFFAFYITLAIAGLNRGLPVDVQASMLRALLQQHLAGLTPPGAG